MSDLIMIFILIVICVLASGPLGVLAHLMWDMFMIGWGMV